MIIHYLWITKNAENIREIMQWGIHNFIEAMIEIIHTPEKSRFHVIVDGNEAYVTYKIENGCLDIRHTVVPAAVEGRGIASNLVKSAYDYALSQGLSCIATCKYAAVWLERHPEYHGHKSGDWCEDGSCGL